MWNMQTINVKRIFFPEIFIFLKGAVFNLNRIFGPKTILV